MPDEKQNFLIEYDYTSSPDAEEMLTQAWDVILALLIEDAKEELSTGEQGETC